MDEIGEGRPEMVKVLVRIKLTWVGRSHSSRSKLLALRNEEGFLKAKLQDTELHKGFKLRTLREGRLCRSESVRSRFRALSTKIAVEGVYRSLEHQAAVAAAFEVTLDLGFNDRGEPPL